MNKCNCYNEEALKIMYDPIEGVISRKTIGRCLGMKEYDVCNCGGDESKCDFYPEKRVCIMQRKSEDYERGYKEGWNAALEYVIARFTKNICKGEE